MPRHLAKFPASLISGWEYMHFTHHRLARVMAFALSVASAQTAQAQGSWHSFQPKGSPGAQEQDLLPNRAPIVDDYLTRHATTDNGRQVANVLNPAINRLLQSGKLTPEEIKKLEKVAEALKQQPDGLGAALEQLAGSQNANLTSATLAASAQVGNSMLAAMHQMGGGAGLLVGLD